MTLISRILIPFIQKHMSQMATTIMTGNLDAFHEHRVVFMAIDGTWDRVEVRGPSATAVEFMVGRV